MCKCVFDENIAFVSPRPFMLKEKSRDNHGRHLRESGLLLGNVRVCSTITAMYVGPKEGRESMGSH